MRTAAGEEEATLEDRVRIGVEFIETGCGKNPINIDSVHVPERITNLRACVDESRVERVEHGGGSGLRCVLWNRVRIHGYGGSDKASIKTSAGIRKRVLRYCGAADGRWGRDEEGIGVSSRTIGGARVPSRPVKIGTLKPRPL